MNPTPGWRCRRAALAASVILMTCSLPAQDGARWPFGGTRGRDPFAERDLWNLGLLGAKGSDAAKPASTPVEAGRRVRAAERGSEGPDRGPSRLRVDLLLPGGPAEKAGLREGDVIAGVDGRTFEQGSLDLLAGSLVRAESQGGPVVLRVERQSPKGPKAMDIAVKVPQGGKDFAEPAEGPARRAIGQKALVWLASRQSGDGGFPETLSGRNGAVVQASVAGLAWLAGGSDASRGRHAAEIAKAVKFVTTNVQLPDRDFGSQPGVSWDQTTWGYAHAAIFLGELCVRSPSPKLRAQLRSVVEVLLARQEPGGGWAHGPGGKNALGYLELNIMAATVVSGFGLAKAAGVKVDRGAILRAGEYLALSSSEDGGVGYSAEPGQKGIGNVGRTAAAWLGFRHLEVGDKPWFPKMETWLLAHAGDVLGGHASLMQHIFYSGLAATALGGDAARDWSRAVRRLLILARAPDGSLQPSPWHESIAMESNTDVSFGEVWTTAAWAAALLSAPDADGRGGLPAWCGTGSRRQ